MPVEQLHIVLLFFIMVTFQRAQKTSKILEFHFMAYAPGGMYWKPQQHEIILQSN